MLRAVGATLLGVLRPGEVVARVGGDAFVAIGPRSDLDRRVAQALRASHLPRVSMGAATAPIADWGRARIAADLSMDVDKPAQGSAGRPSPA